MHKKQQYGIISIKKLTCSIKNFQRIEKKWVVTREKNLEES